MNPNDLPPGHEPPLSCLPADALLRDKARVEQASRDKSAFMARMSHELRTPLNAVLGFARLLEDDLTEPPSQRQRERLRRISEAGVRLLALVDDLLDIARLEAEPLPPVTVPLAAAEVLARVAEGCEALARELGVRLEVGPVASALHVHAEPRRLAQALSLAVEHSLRRAPRGASVGLRAAGTGENAQASARPGCATFVVTDAGPGLTAAQHLWLFEPFGPDMAVGPDDEGSLLRLGFARRLVQAMGGEADARSLPSGVTEYLFELPLAEAPPERAACADAATPLKLLCVEDNPVNLQLVCELVNLRPGIELSTAVDGESGLAAAREHVPDVFLLDRQLPDMGGLELMRRLRAEPAHRGATFIALSADALPDHIESALAAGFDAYWTKPIDFDRFLSGLDGLLAAPRRAHGAASPGG